jgi:hypothetical protein
MSPGKIFIILPVRFHGNNSAITGEPSRLTVDLEFEPRSGQTKIH